MMIRSGRSFSLQLSTLRFIPNLYCIPVNTNASTTADFRFRWLIRGFVTAALYRELPTYKIYLSELQLALFSPIRR